MYDNDNDYAERRRQRGGPKIKITEDSDNYGYNDSNTNNMGEVDGLPMQASDLNNIVFQPVDRKKKSYKPKTLRKIKKMKQNKKCSCKKK